jgi:hypothetical protein
MKQGTNIKFELLETSKNLHAVFAEVNKVLCDEIIGQAVDCYQTFVSYTSGSDNVICVTNMFIVLVHD